MPTVHVQLEEAKRFFLPPFLGVLSAAGAVSLLALIVAAVNHGSLLDRDVAVQPLAVLKHVALPVVIAGVASGALLLRRYRHWSNSRRAIMLSICATTSLVLTVAVGIAYDTVKHIHFAASVMAPEFNTSATEQDVRKRLGVPTDSELAPDFKFIGNFGECDNAKAAKNLIYIEPGGGSYRVLYFDERGKFLCNTNGVINY